MKNPFRFLAYPQVLATFAAKAKRPMWKEKLENDGSIYGIWSDCSAMCLVFAVLPYPRRKEMASRESYDIGQ